MKTTILMAAAIVAALSGSGSAATVLFDFGDTAQQAAGNYNNITPVQDPVYNALDSAGNATGIQLVAEGFNELGPNGNGTTSPGAPANMFDVQATRDNLFGHSDNFNAGSPRPTATLALTGLDGTGSTLYAFTFFASRTGVTDNRETKYAIAGLNNGEGFLNAAANVNNVAVVSGIQPTAAGEITVTVTAGPNNTNTSGFYYLGAMQIESSPVPEPSTCVMAGALATFGGLVRRRRG